MEPEEENGGGVDGINGGALTTESGVLRIYVGGLGENVTVDDLRKTFSSPQLGTVKSVEVVRTKGRSFAYLDFCPCSDKGLAKLFSTYNGCKWKGGRLRLEKAKEHYKLRLKREWEEDAELATISNKSVDAPTESISPPEKPVKVHNSDNVQLRIFFPKLRKVKPIPFKGTGRHKYSFQRVLVPSLPKHFCDCDEHSIPSDLGRGSCNQGNEVYEMKEEEVNMMEAVMNRLFQKEKVSETASIDVRFATDSLTLTKTNGDLQVDDEADEMSDDGNLVINMVGRYDNKIMTNAFGQKTIASRGSSRASQSRPSQRNHEVQGKRHFQQGEVSELPYGKAGYATEAQITTASEDDLQVDVMEDVMSEEDDLLMNAVAGSNEKITSAHSLTRTTTSGNEELRASQSEPLVRKRGIQGEKTVQSKKKSKTAPAGENERSDEVHVNESKENSHDASTTLETDSGIQATKSASEVQHSSHGNQPARRFSWRDLVSGKDDGCFHISDVIPSSLPGSDMQPKPDNSDVSNQENIEVKIPKDVVNKSSLGISPRPVAEARSVEKSTPALQKFSWKQLLDGSGEASFSISQIFPTTNLEKQEVVEVKDSNSPALLNSKQHDVEQNPGEASLNLLNPMKMGKDGRAVEETRTTQLREKQLSPVKPTSQRNNVVEEINSFKRSKTSLKEWKMAKAALSGSHKKKVNET